MNIFKNIFSSKKRLASDRTTDFLSRHLDSDFIVFPMAERPSELKQAARIEEKIGIQLDQELLSHLCGRFPGIYVEVKEEVWQRPKEFEVGPFWSFLYGLHTFTLDENSDPWMRIDHKSDEIFNNYEIRVLPFLKVVGNADVYCFNHESKIVLLDHETGELKNVGKSFYGIFDYELGELKKRKIKKKSGEL